MKKLTLVCVASLILGTFAGAQTAATSRASLHTQNNLTRYSNTTLNNMSRYSRAECNKHRGVMVKQKTGKLVCMAKMR